MQKISAYSQACEYCSIKELIDSGSLPGVNQRDNQIIYIQNIYMQLT